MRLKVRHIVALMLVLALFASCRRARLIPRKELKQIVYEMLMRDQQLKVDRRIGTIPDSILVYEGIFKEHGYNTDDYMYSIQHYLRDPERFSRVFRDVAAQMEKDKRQVEKEIEKRDWRLKYTDIDHMPMDSIALMFYPDSLNPGNIRTSMDSAYFETRFIPHEQDSCQIRLLP